MPSRGCARAATTAAVGVTLQRRLTSGGRTRRFLLVLPDAAGARCAPEARLPLPLVLNFHGLTEAPELQQFLTRMDAEARKRGMVLAYPARESFARWSDRDGCAKAHPRVVWQSGLLEFFLAHPAR